MISTARMGAAATALGVILSAAPSHGAQGPAVELVGTVPIETRLGDPSVRSARDVWLEMIREANRSLDFEQFYLSHWPGEPLGEILDEIGRAARRGVRVRLLLDARMHRTYPQPADSLGTVPGIEVRTLDMSRLGGGVQHAKFFMVDGQALFLGSQNFDWRALKHIHELGVRVRDARVVEEFAQVFEHDWAAAADTTAARSTALPAWRSRPGSSPRSPIRVVQAEGDTVDRLAELQPQGPHPGFHALGSRRHRPAAGLGAPRDRGPAPGLCAGRPRHHR